MRIARRCRDQHPQVRDASFEVVHEAGDRAGQRNLEVNHHACGELAGDGPGRRLVDGRSTGLELGPGLLPESWTGYGR